MNVKILTLVIVLLVSLLCSTSAGEYRSVAGHRCSLFLSVFALLVQKAVVDQLPSMVSFVWALKGRNMSTWLYTVLHCSARTVCYSAARVVMVNLNVVF